jgi:histidine triad (HIT) family protein
VAESCVFCGIIAGSVPAAMVLDAPDVVGFLDVRPVFPGHVLLVPRLHVETLPDLPAPLVGPFFEVVQRVAVAVVSAMGAQGTFVAINNVVSQSVPHLHVHVVPRTKGDGLRGFFWPRVKYSSDDEMQSVAARVSAGIHETS